MFIFGLITLRASVSGSQGQETGKLAMRVPKLSIDVNSNSSSKKLCRSTTPQPGLMSNFRCLYWYSSLTEDFGTPFPTTLAPHGCTIGPG